MIAQYKRILEREEYLLSRDRKVLESINFIRKITNFKPRIALILGSGFGNFTERFKAIHTISSSEIPNYPSSSVQGHVGNLLFGFLQKDILHSAPLLIFQGRIHYYENGSIEHTIFPISLAYHLGIKKLIITNAAGGINCQFNVGDCMLIQDIVTLIDTEFILTSTPLILKNQKYFPSLDPAMKQMVIECASLIKMPLKHGIYGWLIGPSYETPAEIEMLKRIGVDAVGMSTAPEVFLARSLGMSTIGISLISNLAAGISSKKLSHSDVLKAGGIKVNHFSELLEQLVLSLNQ
jgi:purine-nucleoside phosphorylase